LNALSAEELETRLCDIGARRYHRLHPFHKLLHGGACSKGQVQAWALNRYYYQAMIKIKDSLIARCEDSATRREWRSRLVDHDGAHEGDGGIARWLLTDGLGLDRDMWYRYKACCRRRALRRCLRAFRARKNFARSRRLVAD
jgi:coenzyme PQQ biosynthesis protein C